MDIGRELREARERAGLSIEDLTQRTKIKPHKLEALEENAFDRLPDGIYLDGIVRGYAAEVGLDPEVTLSRVRHEALIAGAAAPVVEPIVLHTAAAEGVRDATVVEDFTLADTRTEDPASTAPVVPVAHVMPHVHVMPADAAAPSRRWSGWVMLLLAVIAAAGWGAYLGERSRRSSSVAESSRVPEAAQQGSPEPADSPATITEVPIDRAASSSAAMPDDARRASSASEPVSGGWLLTTQVESSNVQRFSGLRLGYEIELQQNGSRVRGTGRKVSENGTPLDGQSQTPITVEGTLDDNRLHLKFVERGVRRTSAGQFDLQVNDGGVLRGRFTSNAARSRGTVEARRLP